MDECCKPKHDKKLSTNTAKESARCCAGEEAPMKAQTASRHVNIENAVKTVVGIEQMDCPTEENLIRNKFRDNSLIKELHFNLLKRELTIFHSPEVLESILKDIRSLGFEPQLQNEDNNQQQNIREKKTSWWPLGIAMAAAIASELASWISMPEFAVAALAIIAVLFSGITTYKKGWIAIRNGNLNINALMSIAVTGALLIGQWPEAAMVMVLFTLAELIEAKSLDRARNAIQGLIELSPERATVKQVDGTWQEIDTKNIALGSVVRVKPGERIGLDGKIIQGRSSINQAPITGESLPVDKAEGDQVFAGTINQSGSFEYEVTAAANGTTLARIINTVQEAQAVRAPTQRFVDKFSRVYTPTVFIISIAIAIVPPLLMGGSWHEWLYRALVLLVIACPCALVISTPVTVVSGLASAARKGILIKGGTYLEEGRQLKWLALDKTGTITHGKPTQTDFIVLTNGDAESYRSLAASLAHRSDHPVSQAIAKAAWEEKIVLETVDSFSAIPGRGIEGSMRGENYALGNHRLLHEVNKCSLEIEEKLLQLEEQGKTVIALINDQQALALFAVADTIKDSSREAITDLHCLNVKTIMLTGDNIHTAKEIAKQAGIDDACGDQLPDDKLKMIDELSSNGAVGMVGDGINDAPALAKSDIGFAMGAIGTDTAIETADVAIMDDDLRKIPAFIRLSKATYAVLIQNITFALLVKAIFLIITIMGFGSMWMAVFADVGASLLVVANGLRLLKA